MNAMTMNLMGSTPMVQAPVTVEENKLMSDNSNKFLDFETSKVQILTLEQLERTEKENDVNGQPLKGIYHFDLIRQIQDKCQSYGYQPEIYDLFAANNKDRNTPGVTRLPEKEALIGDRAVEAHILRRVFCNIRLRDLDSGSGNEAITTNMAVSFHQKGIQLGIGRNVVICHNQCMLNAENYAATYSDINSGRRSYQLNELLGKADSWLANLRDIVASDDETIERMKQRKIIAQEMFTIIGMLTALRVASETRHKSIRNIQVVPLNQGQISKLTERMMLTYAENNEVTAWDLYNAATDMYKSTQLDQPMILSQNLAMSNFIQQQIL